jgi:hypothetical protein
LRAGRGEALRGRSRITGRRWLGRKHARRVEQIGFRCCRNGVQLTDLVRDEPLNELADGSDGLREGDTIRQELGALERERDGSVAGGENRRFQRCLLLFGVLGLARQQPDQPREVPGKGDRIVHVIGRQSALRSEPYF